MKIDGRKVTAQGTLVIGAGENGELELPFGNFELHFRPQVSPMNIKISGSPLQIVFEGTDSPLGVSASFSLPVGIGTAKLTLAVYCIGEGESATRIIHFTVSQ
ncbi:hypothetical protein [Agrobacterium vitis]|uniref:hypothetical protein n=1 Tax=Agrobacterium vitis TaxID=373 RepID=UPI003D2B3E45